ncbi:hypothetical protein ERJ70_05355 [Sediminibacillus dalangtanensis]|uniref:GPI inositol-deacylase PGAP1-like alpha/beta domain-containing protein n=1 Tax=Sediminibacillus dalangtanensis TaxID=2729421 RepID=A0ABX7VWS6_9BACI|nr:hypothetical protein [Sediminibacillus dalangtanensis]QTM98772.1 hypothetical protein ERJ70_05355 [Sediminibacillus dalangtanensis]
MLKKVLVVFVLLFGLLPAAVLAGSFGKGDPPGNPGEWYVGTTPSNGSDANHPILFVHGLNSSSSTWWEENDMYDTAFVNGFETAFIDLYPTRDMWDNGELLAQKLQEVYSFYGEKVVVVAHSKGGIDVQSAVVHYGAAPYVEKVITLSTPHHGSQLADLAYSSWAGWLAEILGSKNDATYSLQTGYMANFRSITDQVTGEIPFFTFGGTERGSFGSSLYWGGLYLSSYGPNDGTVTVASSRLPYGMEISAGAWNHQTIKQGSSTFELFSGFLSETGEETQTLNTPSPLEKNEQAVQQDEQYGFILRGGQSQGKQTESFYVEKGAEGLQVDWISDEKNPRLQLVGPDRKTYTAFSIEADKTDYLMGAYHHRILISKPISGKWSISADTDQTQHYLLQAAIDSPLNRNLKVEMVDNQFNVAAIDQAKQPTVTVKLEKYKNSQQQTQVVHHLDRASNYRLPDLGAGVYNVTFDIQGESGGEKYQRTVVKSIYVDDKGRMYP